MTVKYATFTLDRRYAAAPSRVFAAWADPAAKARWLVGSSGEHELDFRIGGREIIRGRHGDGPLLTFESEYHDIVPDERIVYSSTMSIPANVTTVSITTVEFVADGDGTRLILTQQGTFLDGHEEPSWREQGTSDQLATLAEELGVEVTMR